MLFHFQCPTCKTKLQADSSASGQLSQCPQCGKSVAVPYARIGTGTIIGGFAFERLLGKGGMGEVYLARQVSMDRHVAVKILPKFLAEDKDAITRFLHEVQMLAKLDHPNIVSAIEAGEDDGVFFLAMGYVKGMSLDVRLRENGAIPEKEALAIVRTVADALAYAWDEFQLLHRDIKPANIMLDRRGRVQLMDLGLAKSFGEEGGLTVSGAALGSPHYMSPEQARGQSDLDVRSDIYSLGATLYHFVTGTTPFSGDSVLEILAKHIDTPPRPARECNPVISPACQEVIEAMMAKDRDNRPGSWRKLIARIDAVSAQATASAKVAEARKSGTAPTPLSRSRMNRGTPSTERRQKPARKAAIAVGVVIAILVGIGIALGIRGRKSQAHVAVAATAADRSDRTDRADRKNKPEETASSSGVSAPAAATAKPKASVPVAAVSTKSGEQTAGSLHPADASIEKRPADNSVSAGGGNASKTHTVKTARPPATANTTPAVTATSLVPAAASTTGAAPHKEPAPDVEPLAHELITGNFGNAFQRYTELKDKMTNEASAPGLNHTIRQVVTMPQHILDSFKGDVGKTVAIRLRKGPTTCQIRDVAGNTIRVYELVKHGKATGKLGRTIRYQDLSVQEKLRRLGKGTSPALNIMRGLLAVEAGRTDIAKKLFSRAGGPLAKALVGELNKRRNKQTELAANRAARALLLAITRSTASRKRNDLVREIRVYCQESLKRLHHARELLAEYQKKYGKTESGKRWADLIRDALTAPWPGERWGGLGMEFVYVPPGTFRMGSNDRNEERPIHNVRISHGFWMGKYEVTQAEYEKLMGRNPSRYKGSRNPVETVSWKDAIAFCKKLTENERATGWLRSGYEYRLPTEAEWEYAARGGPKSHGYTYSGSNDVDVVGWYDDNSENKPHAVGQKRANELRIYDMSGNVFEWCWDGYDNRYYRKSPEVDPVNVNRSPGRVLRGGAWAHNAEKCRVANRYSINQYDVFADIGFRVCLALDAKHSSLTFGSGLGEWSVPSGSSWRITDGLLHAPDKERSVLWTKRSFRNYTLDFDFNLEKGGNSGVFLNDRTQTIPSMKGPDGLEVQICDQGAGGDTECGGIYGRKAPERLVVKKPGEWNHMMIVVRGRHVRVDLNRVKVVDDDVLSAAEVQSIRDPDGTLPPGRIGLQKLTGVVWFRNMRIQELKD